MHASRTLVAHSCTPVNLLDAHSCTPECKSHIHVFVISSSELRHEIQNMYRANTPLPPVHTGRGARLKDKKIYFRRNSEANLPAFYLPSEARRDISEPHSRRLERQDPRTLTQKWTCGFQHKMKRYQKSNFCDQKITRDHVCMISKFVNINIMYQIAIKRHS